MMTMMRKKSQLMKIVMKITILRYLIWYRWSRRRMTTSRMRMKREMKMRISTKRMKGSFRSMKLRMTTMRRPMKMKWMTLTVVYSSGSREGAPLELAMI